MPFVFLTAASCILLMLLTHAAVTRGWKWAAIFTFCAMFFGLWHELNPLRVDDPEYYFAKAVDFGGIPIVGVIGWMEVIYLSWFLMEAVFPRLLKGRILIFPALVAGVIASLFSLCIETTGIAMEWWIWREDRQHIFYPMAGWATQIIFFSSIFFGLFHSTFKTKLLLLFAVLVMLPTFAPQIERTWIAPVLQGVALFSFVFFARLDPSAWSAAARK